MKEVYHYLNLTAQKSGDLNKDNRASASRELIVNCAGSINTSIKHKSINKDGRLDYYLLYMVTGNYSIISGEHTVNINEGDAIVIPPSTPYAHCHTSSKDLNYLWVHFTGSSVEKILNSFGIELFPRVNKVSGSNHLQTRFQRLFDCFIKNDNFMERDLSASLEKLLIELARAIRSKDTNRVSLSKSVNYINNYYNTQIKIPDLAKMDGLSMTQYNLHFKKQMGMPPTKYIIMKRISTAKELIEASSFSLSRIGEMCGYDDYNFFAKVFKQVTGVSPKKFKAETK
ncbi:MAG: helix-turn-helix domain-containing protein [Clostridia bacterium]|nr:helix-turn-helix domain-containing protein [Clostridia bacterium]